MYSHIFKIKKQFLFVATLLLLLGVFFSLDSLTNPKTSVEVGFTSTSPRGVAGGLAIPASCEASPPEPHDATDCVPPVLQELSTSPNPSEQGESYVVRWDEGSFPTTDCTLDKSEDGGATWTLVGAATNCDESTPQSSIIIGTVDYRLTMDNAYGQTIEFHSHGITVKQPDFFVSPPITNEGDEVTINWQCYYSANPSPLNAGTGFSTGGNDSGTVFVYPVTPGIHTYTIDCENTGFRSGSVEVRAPSVNITATPVLVKPGDPSTVSWSADGVNDCVVTGTDGYSDSWDISVGPPLPYTGSNVAGPINEQTEYVITCNTSTNMLVDSVVININPTFEEI